MKIRDGFISNSSSTCFILDKRNQGVNQIIENIGIHVESPHGCDRSTSKAFGIDVRKYGLALRAEEWLYRNYGTQSLGSWIVKWADKLGDENIIFLRESDEGLGGYLFCNSYEDDRDKDYKERYENKEVLYKYELLERLAEDSIEYH